MFPVVRMSACSSHVTITDDVLDLTIQGFPDPFVGSQSQARYLLVPSGGQDRKSVQARTVGGRVGGANPARMLLLSYR